LRKKGFLPLVLIFIVFLTLSDVKSQAANFLWSVEDNSGHQIYLLGSIHLAKPEIYPLNQVIEDAFGRSKRLAVEVDVDADINSQVELTKEILQFGSYPQGEEIWENLDQQTAAQLRNCMDKIGFPESLLVLLRPKPWFLAILIEMHMLDGLGYDLKFGIDMHFLKQAKERGLKIHELESSTEQYAIFAELTQQESIAILLSTFEEIDQFNNGEMDKLVEIWSQGDAEGFGQIYFKYFNEHPEFSSLFDKIIYQRNFRMYDRLQQFFRLHDEITFVVVGSAHLVGPNGLVDLFEKNGYKVTQL
jgi:uncharacterized protein YbaP (TraB family)